MNRLQDTRNSVRLSLKHREVKGQCRAPDQRTKFVTSDKRVVTPSWTRS